MKLTSKNFKFLLNITNPLYTKTPLFNSFQLKSFSHGPYNPLNYKSNAIHEKKVTTEEAYFLAKKYKEFGELPMYSMRHVHAMRQSGPIPPFAGPYTMEDIRNAEASQAVSVEEFNEKVSAEEMMRRVPGLTKKEAVKIQSLNLNPLQQLDYAYIVVNNGIDVFFDPGNGYLMRQVVTNSKGEKIECLYPSVEQDEFTYMNLSTYKGDERLDHVWDPVPGEAPYIVMPDYELQVPASYFEYEIDNRLHHLMTIDQQFIPEDERMFPLPRNPNCTADYWKSQVDLEEQHSMEDDSWRPDTFYDVYNSPSHKGKTKNNLEDDYRV